MKCRTEADQDGSNIRVTASNEACYMYFCLMHCNEKPRIRLLIRNQGRWLTENCGSHLFTSYSKKRCSRGPEKWLVYDDSHKQLFTTLALVKTIDIASWVNPFDFVRMKILQLFQRHWTQRFQLMAMEPCWLNCHCRLLWCGY